MLRIILIFSIVLFSTAHSQISSDNCADAGQLCPNRVEPVNNFNTTINTCLACPDDFDLCFTPLNTAWFKFTTTDNGNAVLRIQNLTFNNAINNPNNSMNLAVFEATVPCFSQSYSLIHCATDIQANTNEQLTGLQSNTTYYVVFSGTQNGTANAPSEALFNVRITGAAVDRAEPEVSIGHSPAEICKGNPVTLIADITTCPENSELQWYKNGSLWLSTPNNVITTLDIENGDEFYALTTCFEMCTENIQTNNLTINIHDFVVDAGQDTTIVQGNGIELSGFTTESNYFWSPPLGLTSPTILNPIASPEYTTTYFLTASNGLCEITDELTITVISDLIVPNVFSPNGDGVNDVWEILGTENYQEVYVVIYDRSGQKVLEAVNYNPLRFWNGTNRGKDLPASTYFYVITLDRNTSSQKVIKGSVTIIR